MTARAGSRGTERGQALVEFALVIPLLLLFLVGIFEFGRAWNVQQVITDAAREGARQGVLPGVTEDSVRATVSRALATAGIASADIGVSPPGLAATAGDPVIVAIGVPYRFTFLGPLMEWTTDQRTITLGTKFTMRHE